MPYIKRKLRDKVDREIEDLLDLLTKIEVQDLSFGEKPGLINYTLTRILDGMYAVVPRYYFLNEAIGILECMKQEYYRRKIAPYEDAKCKESGDVYV